MFDRHTRQPGPRPEYSTTILQEHTGILSAGSKLQPAGSAETTLALGGTPCTRVQGGRPAPFLRHGGRVYRVVPAPRGRRGASVPVRAEIRVPAHCSAELRRLPSGDRLLAVECYREADAAELAGSVARAARALGEAAPLCPDVAEAELRVAEALARKVEELERRLRPVLEEARAEERRGELAARLEAALKELEALRATIEEEMSRALLVAYRAPHEESRALGAEVSIEAGDGTIRITKVVRADVARVTSYVRGKLLAPRLSSLCVRLHESVYLCPDWAEAEVRKVLADADSRLASVGARLEARVVRVRMVREELLDLLRWAEERAREELERALAEAERRRAEGRRHDHWAAKARRLAEALSLIKRWAEALRR